LGVLTFGSDVNARDIIIADIPGLIEGASEGLGLGIRFLKLISRTKALAFMIDLGEENYLQAFDVLFRELEAFSPELVGKKRIIIGTKLDLEETAERLEELKKHCPMEKVLGISVFSGEGIPDLAAAFGLLVTEKESPEKPE
jgi:GTP-binding protein